MTTAPEGRRSRLGWANRLRDRRRPADGHSHPLPRWVRLSLAAQTALILALAVAVAVLTIYVQQLRDARLHEAERSRQQIQQSFCDLLDLFPSGVPALARPRQTYHCGPGAPPGPPTP
jgi:hypothetical protein